MLQTENENTTKSKRIDIMSNKKKFKKTMKKRQIIGGKI